MRYLTCFLVLLAAVSVSAAGGFYAFKPNNIDGKPTALSSFQGKVVLVVNVASSCGYTPQYEGLEKLYREFKPRGLVILGFPSNDFGGQEPGTSQEIKTFCSTKYNVTFPLFEKVVVSGSKPAPLYAFLTEKAKKPPSWNFCKYLIDRQGKVVKFFDSDTEPNSKELRGAVEAALKARS